MTNEEQVKTNPSPDEPELDKCRKERDEYLDGWKRAKAEFLNFKKEENERMGLLTGLIQAEIIDELLPIIESFDRGLTFWSGEIEEKKGMSLIFQKFEDAGVFPLVLTERFVIHKEIYGVAFHLADPTSELFRRERPLAPVARREAERNVVGEAVIFQKQSRICRPFRFVYVIR